MSGPASTSLYRRPSSERLAQGDIGLAEVVQVRSASGSELKGPGPEEVADVDLPYLGEYVDHDLPVPKPGGGREEHRILRAWSSLAIVLTQNCEFTWGNKEDSRVAVAPVVTAEQWPEGPWDYFRKAPPPGYFHLPSLSAEDAQALGLDHPWPEAVVVLASTCTSTSRILKPRRLISLTRDGLVRLQDAVGRFYGTRGFAELKALEATVGKRIASVEETGQVVAGPSQLVKVFVSGDEPDSDDEISVTFMGVRPTKRRPAEPVSG